MKELVAINRSILLVDDDSDILEYIREEMLPHFENVYIASNGVEACELLKIHPIDLIVTDYVMPNMNGLQLIQYVKLHYPITPIIMLTGNSSSCEVLAALDDGAFDIIDKPFSTQVLVNRIQNGLLVPELMKTIWELMSHDMGVPRLKDFLRKPLAEQNRIIYAYSSLVKMKSMVQKAS